MQFMDVLKLFAGLALFLYGIKEMGEGLEKAAGHRMQRLLEVLTKNKFYRRTRRRARHGRDSKLKRNHRDGGRFRQCRSSAAVGTPSG